MDAMVLIFADKLEFVKKIDVNHMTLVFRYSCYVVLKVCTAKIMSSSSCKRKKIRLQEILTER
jgi:hypothetical protein